MIGIVGIGNMGLAMAQRLRDADHPVAACDIDPSRCALARDAGCSLRETPALLAADADVLIVAVVDGAQMNDVLFGRAGAASTLRRGSTVLLCPTVSPLDVQETASRLMAQAVDVIDAPMSGGPQRAREGTMSLMVAGEQAAIERCRPLLDRLSSRVFLVGNRPGDGARTKLVNNLLAAANLAAAAEALALAQRWGLDPALTLSVVEQSSGHSWIASDRGRRLLAGDDAVLARVALLAKDAGLALAAAQDAGLDAGLLPVAQAAAATFAAALQSGLADADDSALLSQVSQRWPAPGAAGEP
jgi:3-hydroxyisobutyrate dehydrogenase-like beta-hydroxyacid dehydrogenase